MEINARILSMRKHKNVTFLDCYTGECGKLQFMIENDLLISNDIGCGDYIKVTGNIITNKSGNEVFLVSKFLTVSNSSDWNYYKGINNKTSDVKQEILFNARNGGSQLFLLQYKKSIITKIKNVLEMDNFEDMTTLLNVVERHKNGSKVVDAEINNRNDKQPRFLRITLENQLKQACAILLKSVYSIDKAFRNMGEDNGHLNEFLLLELISLDYKIDDMIKFIYKMDQIARNEFYNFDNVEASFISKLEIIDYNNIIKNGETIEDVNQQFENVLILNYPALSPFIRINSNGEQVEARWYMRGKYIGHFYEDENDFKQISELIKKQNILYNVEDEDINTLEYFNWGLPETTSFGISIDRWLQLSLNEDNINTIANPLGLDYAKTKRRRNL